MNRVCYIVLLVLLWMGALSAQEEVFLWPASDSINDSKDFPFQNYQEQNYIHPKRGVEMARFVTHPSLRIFLADSLKNTGAGIIICPGGGMNVIELEHEGTKIGKAFAEMGINAFVLKYRHYSMDIAREDAKRAMQLIRSKARKWHLNSNAIGIGGFSAGGSLSLFATYDAIENAGDPCNLDIDFLVLVYTRAREFEEQTVRACFPPTFQLVTADDFRYEMNIDFYRTLQAQRIPSELHIFQMGKHGFGLGMDECNCEHWPNLFYRWLQNNNFIQKS